MGEPRRMEEQLQMHKDKTMKALTVEQMMMKKKLKGNQLKAKTIQKTQQQQRAISPTRDPRGSA